MKTEYTREELLAIIEKSWVPESKWLDRDSAQAQAQLGHCYAWLKAGCAFKMSTDGKCTTGDETIWVDVYAKGFGYHDYGGRLDEESFYIPTEKRLASNDGKDWY
jgi:hypothetical protein